MCVIAVVTKNGSLQESEIKLMWEANPHGAGLAYVTSDNVVKIVKGLMTLKEALEGYSLAKEDGGKSSPLLMHFRLRTHGARDEERTHPFAVGGTKEAALVHNGVFSGMPDHPTKSDTQLFCERYPRLFNDSGLLMRVKDDLGDRVYGNKIAVLFPKREVVIINESRGLWEGDVWFSNAHWKSNYNSSYYDKRV